MLKGDIQNYLRFQLQFPSGAAAAAAQVPWHSGVADTVFTLCWTWTSPKVPRPAEPMAPITCRRWAQTAWRLSSKHQPLPPPETLCQAPLCSAQGRAAPGQPHAHTSPAVSSPKRHLTPGALSALGAKRRSSHLGPYQNPPLDLLW